MASKQRQPAFPSLNLDRIAPTKRRLMQGTGLVLAGSIAAIVTVPGLVVPAEGKPAKQKSNTTGQQSQQKQEEEVTPPEDLMREHGVLDRVLLVYEAALRKFSGNEDFDPAVITGGAQIIRDFIENYHEQSEEHYLFPRFKQAGRLVDLVDVLDRQHKAGRRVTATILQAAPNSRKDGDDRRKVIDGMQAFITMYRPHAAREDTELFPKLKDVVSPHEYDAMAEDFEKEEHRRFGEDGFELMVGRVAKLEQSIGINNLDQFTPHV
jgi:hemerythrin-like domain-containing protein